MRSNPRIQVRCADYSHEKLITFFVNGGEFCPSCDGRRMAQMAAQLGDHVIPNVPVLQWILSLPIHCAIYSLPISTAWYSMVVYHMQNGVPEFCSVLKPTTEQLQGMLSQIIQRIMKA